jgi:hypothetical protein
MGLSLFPADKVSVSDLFAHDQSAAGLTLSGGIPATPTVQEDVKIAASTE